MSINIGQIILDAQRLANRVKDLDALGNALLVEAEGNNRAMESMRQFQDDIDSLNKLARNKSNSDMINRINQQNPSIREIRQENRELKASLEDHQRALELVMHKYREHTQHKIFQSRVNFKELYNEKLSEIIKKQSDKITEMAAVMQKAAFIDDEAIYKELEWMNKLKIENQGLREMLKIANEFGSANITMSNFDSAGPSKHKYIQTENGVVVKEIPSTSETVTNNCISDLPHNTDEDLENCLPDAIPLLLPGTITEANDDMKVKIDVDMLFKPDVDLYKTIKKGKIRNIPFLNDKEQIELRKNEENFKELTKIPEKLIKACENDNLENKSEEVINNSENCLPIKQNISDFGESTHDESETDDDSTLHNLSNGSTEEMSDDENNITLIKRSTTATTTNDINEENRPS